MPLSLSMLYQRDKSDKGGNIEMSNNADPIQKDVLVEWVIPDALPALRSTSVAIQPTTKLGEFVIAFFEQQPPFYFGTPTEQLEQFAKLEKLKAMCVARISLSYETLVELARITKEGV